MDVATAAKQAGLKASEARIVHQRPALIQELEWQPSDYRSARESDPIRTGLRPKINIAYHSNYAEIAPVLARWEDAQHSYNLVTSDGGTFALVMYSKPRAALAETAITEAIRLDIAEAPQRANEAAGRKLDEDRVALEKARALNAPNFRP